jgi:SNF2 family DNA or RNA helicase
MSFKVKNLNNSKQPNKTQKELEMDYALKTVENILKNSLTSDSEMAPQPNHIRLPLKIHQRALLNAARKLETNRPAGISFDDGAIMYTKYGVIADRVGSGKSLVALSLAGMDRPQTEMFTAEASNNHDVVVIKKHDDNKKLLARDYILANTSLMVIPHSLVNQWERYVKDQTTLKVLMVKQRKQASSTTIKEDIKNLDLIIVSSTMWKDFAAQENINKISWARLFIDEADTCPVSITGEDSVRAAFYWFISASWLNMVFPSFTNIWRQEASKLLYPLAWDAFKNSGNYIRIEGVRRNNIVSRMCVSTSHANLRTNYSWRLILRNNEDFIQQSLKMPEIIHHRWTCAIPQNVQLLHDMIGPQVMEMLHAGDHESALEALGIQEDSATNVVEGVTKHLQQQLETAIKFRDYRMSTVFPSEKAKQEEKEKCDGKIAEIEVKLAALKERVTEYKDKSCPICFCDLEKPTLTPCCKNLFCFVCMVESLRRNPACPLCRATISLPQLKVLGDKSQPKEKKETKPLTNEEKTKAVRLLEFLESNKTAKVLLFSNYDKTFNKLTPIFEEKGITYSMVNGTSARIQKIIREFGEGKHQVLCLNARHFGAGLNIEVATHVILFHRMAEEIEKQIIGRAYRFGRQAELEVIHLLHANETGAAYDSNHFLAYQDQGNVVLHL